MRRLGGRRALKRPDEAAAMMMSGNGKAKKKIATNAAAARACKGPLFSERRPMRIKASTTIASTAAFRPKKAAAT
jgi:hypothetical protein